MKLFFPKSQSTVAIRIGLTSVVQPSGIEGDGYAEMCFQQLTQPDPDYLPLQRLDFVNSVVNQRSVHRPLLQSGDAPWKAAFAAASCCSRVTAREREVHD